MLAMMCNPSVDIQIFTLLLAICDSQTVREFCVNQSCTVMHSTAFQGIGRPGNSLINKAQEIDGAN
jgi:hypothetical protein